MLKVTLADRPEFLASDHTYLREILHPAKQQLALNYSLAHGRLLPGQRSKRHILASSEVYYFLSGFGRFTVGGQVVQIEAGTTVYVAPGEEQSLENVGSVEIAFLCLVDPAWRTEDEQVLE